MRKSNPTPTRNTYATPLEEKVLLLQNQLPSYVTEYVEHYYRTRALNTIYQYLSDIKDFFNYLIEKNLCKTNQLIEIEFDDLESLKRMDVERYFNQLRNQGYKEVSINKKIAAMKSLFRYLTEISENVDGEPYFHRNVFKKITMSKERNLLHSRANAISTKIFHGNEDVQFLQFIATEYEESIKDNQKKRTRFIQNKERDLAILSLFLGSGLRVSELASLTLSDINMKHQCVEVIRKGHQSKVSVMISSTALDDLKTYLEVRNTRYKLPLSVQELWVTGNKKGTQNFSVLSVRAIQALVKKYTAEFGLSTGISPHKLRHTVGTKVFVKSGFNMIAVKEQLGHLSTQTTELYTHLHNEKLQKIMDDINIEKEKEID